MSGTEAAKLALRVRTHEDYGFVGDTHSGALIGLNGSIDWLCLPRFDSDACFAGLGLIAEEYDTANRRLVGNFPQAFSHVGLINSARNLSPKQGPAEHRANLTAEHELQHR